MSTTWKLSAYQGALADLTAGTFTSNTACSALMLSGAYSFGFTHSFATITASEISGGGYTRVTANSKFTVTQQGQYWWFYTPTPGFQFSSFTGTFRSILIYNATTNQPYLLAKANSKVTVTASTFLLASGGLPWMNVSAQ